MSLDAPESAHHDLSELLHMAILLVWAWMMVCDTEWMAVDKNLVEAEVSDYALFTVSICVLRLLLRCFFGTLVGVLAIVDLIGTTEYLLMEFTVLSLLKIS